VRFHHDRDKQGRLVLFFSSTNLSVIIKIIAKYNQFGEGDKENMS